MSNTEVNYWVFIHAYLGAPRNHHGIFVELEEDGSGYLYHVEGNVQTGMTYNPKPARPPLDSPSFQGRKPIGWVPASLYQHIHTICSNIPPPPKQYDGPKLLVPKNQLRRCQEWTNEVVNELRVQGVLQGNEGGWVPRTDLEKQSKSPKSKSKVSSSQSKSKPSVGSKSSSSSFHPASKSSPSSSTSEPADGTVSADGNWVYSKHAKDWYHMGQDGTVTWGKQTKGKGK